MSDLFKLNCDWLNKLIKVKDIASLQSVNEIVPDSIKKELEKLLSKAKEVKYSNIIIAPLYYGT
ncbi:ATP phosphoribosyltransferase regulatory subunit, partial [Aliarcobacter butzleri]